MGLKKMALALGGIFLTATGQAALKAGDAAPQVSAPLSDGTTFDMTEWLKKAPLVIYFYPKDDTPGCTTEACGLRDDIGAFRNLAATVVGVSYDTIESHKKFIDKYKLPFPLIADTDKTVAKAFGVARPLAPLRATFIIGKDGKIAYANPSVNPKTHSREVREALERLKS
jgi:peroxiredoxin Q/BCP